MKRIVWQMFCVAILFVATLAVSALAAYASSMVVLILGLETYGYHLMLGIFLFSAVSIFMANYNRVMEIAGKKAEKKTEVERNYFEDGNFSRR